eukprot:scaffold193213_cov36-Prasinocladus_malaysianus.AAC.2
MKSVQGASRAATSALGDLKNPLLTVPYSKEAATVEEAAASKPAPVPQPSGRSLFASYPPQQATAVTNGKSEPSSGQTFPTFPGSTSAPPGSFPSFQAPPVGSAHQDYENVTLMKMRQAAERARLIKEMEAEAD